ncbi:MAG: hypothetical protein AAF845_15530 [Bacteroidota bacterium]
MRPLAAALAALLLGATPAAAQYAEGGARVLGLGRAGVALGAEAWATTNPAARSGLDAPRLGVQASQAFGLSELQVGTLAAAAPTPVGVLGLGARTYGFDERRETRLTVGIARPIPLTATRALDAGLVVGYEAEATEGFESRGAVVVSAGVQGQLLPGLRGGLAGRNLLGLFRTEEDDLRLGAATVPGLTAGIAYAPSERATLVLDADQDLDFGLSVRAGAEVVPVDVLALRIGVSTEPTRLSAGAGVRLGGLRADVAVERHEALGLTPAFGVEVSL